MLGSLHCLHRLVHIRWALLAVAFFVGSMPFGALTLLAQDGANAEFNFTFENDSEGWEVDFADLPIDHDQSSFELDSGHRPLPEGLEGGGIYVQGHNRSDDLFMFLKRQVENLRPNATYAVSVSMDLATNVPPGTFGIGGSPGESVYVKAGASTIEPRSVEGSNRHLRLNIDKGNQSNGGESMVVMGHVANPEVSDTEYRIKTLDNMDSPLSVETDDKGRVWLIVGTDSGYEGLSTLYYARITYALSIVGPPVEPTPTPSIEPTAEPTIEPTAEATMEPTVGPTAVPTVEPTAELSPEAVVEPTAVPRDVSSSKLPASVVAVIAVAIVALLSLVLLVVCRRINR